MFILLRVAIANRMSFFVHECLHLKKLLIWGHYIIQLNSLTILNSKKIKK